MSDDNIINFPDDQNDDRWIEKVISHPCETALNIEPNTTTIVLPAPRETELVDSPLYDDKDKEIEQNFQDIYDASMDTFDQLQEDMDGIEGKYKARNSEVAVMYLNAALAAANAKLKLKEGKDRNKGKQVTLPGDTTITNNTQINVTTAELVKMMAGNRSPINNTVNVPIAYQQEELPKDSNPSDEAPTHTRKKIPRIKTNDEKDE